MSYIMTTALLIAGILVALLLVFVWKLKRKGWKQETDYRAFFTMGLVWMIAGAALMLWGNYSLSGLFSIGVIFFILGLAHRDEWGRKKKPTPKQKRTMVILTVVGIVVIALGVLAFFVL